jgi:2-phosphosulfolactate phosphatase
MEVLMSPAEFATLPSRDLSQTVCVVFDILRATSSIVTALGNGADAVIPVSEISEALALRKRRPEILLAGERDGVRIEGRAAGGTAFDLGNSPREFTSAIVRGRTIAMTTTNGTRALRACARAGTVLLGAFLNLTVTVQWIQQHRPAQLLLVCSGTGEEAAYEDCLAAGAFSEALLPLYRAAAISDSVLMARQQYASERANLVAGLGKGRNGTRLLYHPALKGDIAVCAQLDAMPVLASMAQDGIVTASAPK